MGQRVWPILGAIVAGFGIPAPALAAMPSAVSSSLPNPPFTLARVDACFLAPTGSSTGWPLSPTWRVHAIRGSFNEPRAADQPHFGVDVEAVRNRADVYAIASGVASGVGRAHFWVTAPGGSAFWYWHVQHLATIHDGGYVFRGQRVGTVFTGYYHVHIAEFTSVCRWVNPMRPTGPLYVAANTERPSIGLLRAFRGNAAAFQRFPTGVNPATLTDPATAEPLDHLHGFVDLRARVYDWPTKTMKARRQLELEPAAIRAWLAPADDRHRHLSRLKRIYDGATLFRPALLGTNRWHVWAFGTWRQNRGYYQTGPNANLHLGADYVWHVGGTRGLYTPNYPNGTYKYCVQALTINGKRGTRCTPVVIAN